MANTASPSDQHDIEKGRTNAILAYITPIGWLVAFILHSQSKTKFAAFHLRQALGLAAIEAGLMVFSAMFMFFYFRIFFLALEFANLVVLVFAILGIMNANNGKKTPLPLIGDFLDKTFSGLN